MRAKRTTRNRITLPQAIVSTFPGVSQFDVTEEDGCIVLTPVELAHAEVVRDPMAQVGITEQDIADVVK